MPWDNNNIYDPMSAVPGAVPAPRPAGQNPAATNYVPGRYAGVADAVRGPGQSIGNVTGWQDRSGGQHGEVRDARWYQNQVIQALQRQAAGDPNSQAQQQLRQSLANAQAQQASLGSTMRGQSAGAAMRSIRAGQQGIQRTGAGEAQMLQLQEQEAARQALAQLLAQQQGLDQQRAQMGADLGLGTATLSNQGLLSSFGNQLSNILGQKQLSNEVVGAMIGQNIAQGDLAFRRGQQAAGAAGTATATLADVLTPAPQPQYRQIDGSDSIVPYGEK